MKSISTLLTLRLLLGGTLLLGAAGFIIHWQVRRALTSEFDATLRARAQSLVALTEQKQGQANLEFTGEIMPQFERADGPEVFLLRTASGQEIERSASLGKATLPMRASSPQAPAIFDVMLPGGRAFRCAGMQFTPSEEEDDGSESHPTTGVQVLLVVGLDRLPLDHALAVLRTSLLVVGSGALALLVGLIRWGVRGGLSPLARLGESVAAVDGASLSTRFPEADLPSELRPIATRLNELLARLESAFALERRFTATAAHELRTPLAELRTLAEVNLTTPGTDAELVESWNDTLATTMRMESLTQRLLELTRAEDPTRTLLFQPVLLVEALAAAWRPWATRAAERHIEFMVAVPPDLAVRSDPALLGVILDNLCANAVEHAPAASPLRITATRVLEIVTIHFQNRPGDIKAADLPHLFERFWRKDISRADPRHHGLGLALAAEFTALLGGALTARIDTSGELDFAIQLPVSDYTAEAHDAIRPT